jgi:PAS domain S-box-containing protein
MTPSTEVESPLRNAAPPPWLHALVSNVQDAIVLLDRNGRVTFESPSACDILGIPPDDALSAFGLKRIHPDERDAVVESFARTIATPGAVSRATYRFQRADGSWRHLEALAKNLLHDSELNGVLITFRDVTERTRALEQLRQADRRHSQLITRVSESIQREHRAIADACSALRLQIPESRVLVQRIENAVGVLSSIVEEAMTTVDVQAVHTPVTQSVDLPRLVEEAVREGQLLSPGRSVRVTIRCGVPPQATVMADRRRLLQSVTNLIAAANRFSSEGGEVQIGWESPNEASIRILIRQVGLGISEATVQRVFDRYERERAQPGADGSLPGAGLEDGDTQSRDAGELGLAVAQRLVAGMGGVLGIENVPGSGALFWIELPRRERTGLMHEKLG